MPHQDSTLYKTMLDATRETFENMAFAEIAEQPEELTIELPAEAPWVSILVHDPLQGELKLAMSDTLLTEITSDMFALDKNDVEAAQKKDIIAELLNTLAGLFMTKLLPNDQTYQLGLPEHGDENMEIEEGSVIWKLQIEEQPLIVVASGVSLTSATF